ncbi:MAG TPA: VanZ family protein [Terriglobales bacterium]|nr:VanZ family protein [Terriglobales bacterium]
MSSKAGAAAPVRAGFVSWVPAIGWSLMTLVAAGDLFSAMHTGHLLLWLIGLFSAHPNAATVELVDKVLRKVGHFVNYAILSWFWFAAFRYWSLRERSHAWKRNWSILAVALTVATAIGDELLQRLTPSRTSSPYDVLIDTAGAITMQFVIYWYARKRGSVIAS